MCRLCDIENVDDDPYRAVAQDIKQSGDTGPRAPGMAPELGMGYGEHTTPDCPAAILEKIIEQPEPAAIHIGEEDQTA